jgi:uncharacterized protein
MRTLKNALVVLLIAGLFTTVSAQDKALLYEVSGKDLKQPSYLYGTFHLVCPADLQMNDAIRKALGDARQLYLELDFDDPALQTSMMKGMTMGDGKTLKDVMKAEDYGTLDTYLQQRLGMGLTQMGALKPVALLSFMFMSMLKCQPASYDLTFAQMAGKDGKDVLGLETLEEQMAVLEKIPLDEQIKTLLEMARKPEEAQKEIASLMTAYRAQDLPQLMKLINESKFDGEPEGFKEDLLDKRNNNWIPIIEKAARDKATFFAFGAGHLGGNKGVVNLLREKGYTVKPIQ